MCTPDLMVVNSNRNGDTREFVGHILHEPFTRFGSVHIKTGQQRTHWIDSIELLAGRLQCTLYNCRRLTFVPKKINLKIPFHFNRIIFPNCSSVVNLPLHRDRFTFCTSNQVSVNPNITSPSITQNVFLLQNANGHIQFRHNIRCIDCGCGLYVWHGRWSNRNEQYARHQRTLERSR